MSLLLFSLVLGCSGGDTTVAAGFVSTEDDKPAQGIVIVIVGDDEDSEPADILTAFVPPAAWISPLART